METSKLPDLKETPEILLDNTFLHGEDEVKSMVERLAAESWLPRNPSLGMHCVDGRSTAEDENQDVAKMRIAGGGLGTVFNIYKKLRTIEGLSTIDSDSLIKRSIGSSPRIWVEPNWAYR